MALCDILQSDFRFGFGRYDDRGSQGYSDDDLRFAIEWAQAYIDEGLKNEPLWGYNLRRFQRWCRARLNDATALDGA